MKRKYLLVLAAASALSLAARADIIPSLSSITGSSPNFTWNYSANVTVDETINRGDFFTIYDFFGWVPGSQVAPSALWNNTTNATNVALMKEPQKAGTNTIGSKTKAEGATNSVSTTNSLRRSGPDLP